MSYDLMILSVGAKHKDNIFQSSIIAERLNGFGISNNERYPFAGKIKGTWFELKKYDSLPLFGSFDLCDFDFNIECKPAWRLENEDTDHYSLFFKSEKIFEDFKLIVKSIQNLSPQNMIVFLPRLQGSEMNDICGVIALEEFFGLLTQGKIYSNLCYIIQN